MASASSLQRWWWQRGLYLGVVRRPCTSIPCGRTLRAQRDSAAPSSAGVRGEGHQRIRYDLPRGRLRPRRFPSLISRLRFWVWYWGSGHSPRVRDPGYPTQPASAGRTPNFSHPPEHPRSRESHIRAATSEGIQTMMLSTRLNRERVGNTRDARAGPLLAGCCLRMLEDESSL